MIEMPEFLRGNSVAYLNAAPPLDVRESEDRFEVRVDLPGLEPEDVNVTFEDGMLTISGKRQFENENKGETWHRVERGFGTFARSVRLPQTADPEKSDASFAKGVLSVIVPKSEQAKPKTIQVNALSK